MPDDGNWDWVGKGPTLKSWDITVRDDNRMTAMIRTFFILTISPKYAHLCIAVLPIISQLLLQHSPLIIHIN